MEIKTYSFSAQPLDDGDEAIKCLYWDETANNGDITVLLRVCAYGFFWQRLLAPLLYSLNVDGVRDNL